MPARPTPSPSLLLALCCLAAGCSDSSPSSSVHPAPTGTVTVTLGDPPTCRAPIGNIQHVFVTVTRVRVHASSEVGGAAEGWVDLIDRRDAPLVVDLLDARQTACAIVTLGEAQGVPAGTYQQVRLHLLENDPPFGTPVPDPNPCGSEGFNCVELQDGTVLQLELSSQAKTGLKVPPGRIDGGSLLLEPLLDSDLHIDFDACSSIIFRGNGRPLLKPTLHAAEIELEASTVSGRLVDADSGLPFIGTAIVTVQVPDEDGTLREIRSAVAAPDGTFRICPLPEGEVALVISGIDDVGDAYGPTVLLDVPVGEGEGVIGDVQLRRSTDPFPVPATVVGRVTSERPDGGPAIVAAALRILQRVNPPDRLDFLVTVPLLPGSDALIPTGLGGSCDPGESCADYLLRVPASHALVGVFDRDGTRYTVPGTGSSVPAILEGQSFDVETGQPTCSPPVRRTDTNDLQGILLLIPGETSIASTLRFIECED